MGSRVRGRGAIARALIELGFAITDEQSADVRRCKDFVQLKNGPFEMLKRFVSAQFPRHVETPTSTA
jgi:hypothetical protein